MKSDPAVQAAEITGTLTVDKSLQEKIPESSVLFIFARPAGVTGGPPLAVKRINNPTLPHAFNIGPIDVMIPDTPFEGDIRLTARLDRDGNAKSSPGDIEGSLETRAGEKGLSLVLNRIIPLPSPDESQVSGVIELDPKWSGKLPENVVLFLFARARDEQNGPPLAVKRLVDVQFPYEFQLGQADAMMPGSVFTGDVLVVARLDTDGNASTRKGDLQGFVQARAGDKAVKIVMNEISEE